MIDGPVSLDPRLLQRGGVRFERAGPTATVVLDRPEVHNAQLPATWEALSHLISRLPSTVRVLVVRGAGASFSAGLDRSAFTDAADGLLARLAGSPLDAAGATIASFQAAFDALATAPAVTVAAVHGHAIGAGFQLALACDVILAADSARFRMAEVTLGLVPDLGGTRRLVDAIGRQRALEICATGRPVTGAQAAALGLALRCVPDAELSAAVEDLTAALLANPEPAVRAVTSLVRAAGVVSAAEHAEAERAEQWHLLRELAERGGATPAGGGAAAQRSSAASSGSSASSPDST